MALTKVTGQVIKNTTDVTVGVLTVTNTLAVGGTVSIGGTLTYEDVTNVDAVGLITARNGIVVGSGITLSKDGDGFFTGVITATSYSGIDLSDVTGATGDFSIADKIVHTGDTDTAIRFPSANTVTVEAAGVQKLSLSTGEVVFNDTGADCDFRIEGDTNANLVKVDAGNDRVGVGLAAPQQALHVYHATDNGLALFESGDANCRIDLKDNSGQVSLEAVGDNLLFGTSSSNTERMRVTSAGSLKFTGQGTGLDTATITHHTNNNLYIRGGTSGLILSNYDSTNVIHISESDFIKFETTDGTERMRITGSGNLDINTPPWTVTGGDYRNLSVSGSVASSGGFLWLGNGAAATNADQDLGRINFLNNTTIVSQITGTTQTSANDDGRIAFLTKETGGNLTERVRIKSDGDFGVGLTNPTAKLHAQDDSATATEILKLRNYKSSVNTKPGLSFEASTTAGQGGTSTIQGLCGTDAGGSDSNNDSGMNFIVRHGGSGTERSVMELNSDGVIRHSAVYKQRPVDGTGANIFYRTVFGPSNIGPGNSGTYTITNGHAAGIVHLFVYRNTNSALNRGIAYGFHLRSSGQANLSSSIYDFSGTSGAPPFTFTQGNQGVVFTNNASYTVTVSITFELTGKVDG